MVLRKYLLIVISIALGTVALAKPPSHQPWTQLLQKYVSPDGTVDYPGLKKERNALNAYLKTLSDNPPENSWSREEKMAYWINVYNAFTASLIVENYPVESIKDLHPTLYIPGIRTVWHEEFFKIGGEDFNLDTVEHGILRKDFDEPRIHFAINCASKSCPRLRQEAYEADRLDAQLTDQTRYFLQKSGKNDLSPDQVRISKIFSWFKGDFTKDGSLIDFLNQYSDVQINPDADVDHKDYDWTLNE